MILSAGRKCQGVMVVNVDDTYVVVLEPKMPRPSVRCESGPPIGNGAAVMASSVVVTCLRIASTTSTSDQASEGVRRG